MSIETIQAGFGETKPTYGELEAENKKLKECFKDLLDLYGRSIAYTSEEMQAEFKKVCGEFVK